MESYKLPIKNSLRLIRTRILLINQLYIIIKENENMQPFLYENDFVFQEWEKGEIS